MREMIKTTEEWKSIFDSITDLIFLLDKESSIICANKAFCSAINIDENNIVGKKCFEIFHNSNSPFKGCPNQETLKDKKTHILEIEKSNLGIPLLITTSPLFDNKGEMFATVHIAKDISKLKEAQNELNKKVNDLNYSNNKLQAALNDLKTREEQIIQAGKLAGIGQMASGVAHEINNPLTSILGYSQLILSNRDIEPSMKEDLFIIEKEAKRCVDIIERLLDFARPNIPHKIDVSINNIIKSTLKIIEYSAIREKIEIVEVLDVDLPRIIIDPNQIQQVFLQLIMNAINSIIDEGKIIIKSSLFIAENKEKFVCVSFIDTGCGIPKENKHRLFEPFFTTAHSTGKKGVGLGLSISHTIIKEHNGRIEVNTEEGKGSTFSVFLPI